MRYVALAVFVLLVGVVSIWLSNVGQPWWLAPLGAMFAAVSLLSMLLLGDSNALFQRIAKRVDAFLFANATHSGITLTVLVAALIVAGWQAWETRPPTTDYLSVSVYREQPRDGMFAVGAQVILFSETEGASWRDNVDNNGLARFEGMVLPTNIRLQIDEVRAGRVMSWVPPRFVLATLPAPRDYDLAEVPATDWVDLGPVDGAAGSSFARAVENAPGPRVTGSARTVGDLSLQPLNAPWGLPSAPLVVNRNAYILGVDVARRLPLWTAYAVGVAAEGLRIDRSRQFTLDPAVPREMQTDRDQYRRSGFDRGHLVSPREVLFKGKLATEEAGYLTALTPQTPGLNRFTWNNLEKATMALAAELGREVFVLNGPLYDADGPVRTIGPEAVPVPTHFFRLVVWIDAAETLQSAAYLIPNADGLDRSPAAYAVSIGELEHRTGLTMLPDLPPDRVNDLKSAVRVLPDTNPS